MKKKIEVFDYAATILNAVKKGVLLTTRANGKVNTMSISWGALGIEWNKPIFTTYVREGRFTRELLDANGEFTVNVPLEGYLFLFRFSPVGLPSGAFRAGSGY